MNEVFEIGNGQAANTELHEICGTLDCMHDQKALLIRGANGRTTVNTEPPERLAVQTDRYLPDVELKNGNGGE